MSPEALPGAPGSLKRRMAEREAARNEALRRGLAEQLTSNEWHAPAPPAILRQNAGPDVSRGDLAATWKRLQAAQEQQRAAEVAGTEPYSFISPPPTALTAIELFLAGKIGLWQALFGSPEEVDAASSESSQMPAAERRIRNTSPTGRGRINTTSIPAMGAAGHVPLFGPAMDLVPKILGPGPSGPPRPAGENPLGRPGNPDDSKGR
jgi:hypothetical protein